MATITLEIPDFLAKAVEDSGNDFYDILETGLSMIDPVSIYAYQEAINLLEHELSDQAIVEFEFSEKVLTGMRALLHKNNASVLSPAEKAELDGGKTTGNRHPGNRCFGAEPQPAQPEPGAAYAY